MPLTCGNENLIPRALSRKVSPWLVGFAGGPGRLLGITIIALGLAVSLIGGDGFVYFIIPWFCPSLVAVLYTWVPLRPYRGLVYDRSIRDVDTNDLAAMRLVELFKSNEARQRLWRQALLSSAILILAEIALAIVFRNTLNYNPPSPQNEFMWANNHGFWPSLMACSLGCYLAEFYVYVAWGLTKWAKGESVHGAMPGPAAAHDLTNGPKPGRHRQLPD